MFGSTEIITLFTLIFSLLSLGELIVLSCRSVLAEVTY